MERVLAQKVALALQGAAADLAAEAAETEGALGFLLYEEAQRLVTLGRSIEQGQSCDSAVTASGR